MKGKRVKKQKLLIKKFLALSISANNFLAKLIEIRLVNHSTNTHFLIKEIKLSNSEIWFALFVNYDCLKSF